MTIILTPYQLYLFGTLALAAILYIVEYRKKANGIFKLIALMGKLSLIFFVVVDMILPQFALNFQIYPDPYTLMVMLVVIFGDFFPADKGESPKKEETTWATPIAAAPIEAAQTTAPTASPVKAKPKGKGKGIKKYKHK